MTSLIEWTDETWNPIVGCSRISPGCANCYAAEAARSARLQQFPQYQSVKSWNGSIAFVYSQLYKPLKWRKNKRIFVCSMSDLFHENISDADRDKIFAVMAIANQHTFQVLTKRPENMLRYLSDSSVGKRWAKCVDFIARADELNLSPCIGHLIDELEICNGILPNIWLGTTVENQEMADKRIPILLQTPAKIRFLSCEPLLEKVSLKPEWFGKWTPPGEYSYAGRWDSQDLHWVIAGGESGNKARSCHIDWIKSLVNQCKTAGVPIFVKQLGSNAIGSSPYIAGVADTHYQLKFKDRKGGNPEEWPEEMPREFPKLNVR